MKDKLKNAYKPTPERFGYAVDAAIEDALAQAETTAPRKRLSRGWRAVIAVAVIAALIPSAVFGASKLYGLFAQPVDNYGLAIGMDDVEIPTEYPQYVKMHVEIPEGFAEVPNTDGLKYYSLAAEQPYTDGFSLDPMRFTDDAEQKEYIGNVGSYEALTVSDHQAYRVVFNSIGFDRLYVYYEDVNVFLLIYYKDVTDEQLRDFVSGISFTEGTASDHTYLDTPFDERPQEDDVVEYDEEFIELPRDTKLSNLDYGETIDDELPYTAQITDVRVVSNINGLNSADFSDLFDIADLTDDNGNLLPKTTTVIKEGDGFTTQDEILSEEESDQVLVLADVTYTNLSGKDMNVYIPYRLDILNQNDDGSFSKAGSISREEKIYTNDYCSSEIFYLSPHGDNLKNFYCPALPADSSMTVTVGFLCNADQLDKAYLIHSNMGSITEPAYTGDNFYAYYIFKVQ